MKIQDYLFNTKLDAKQILIFPIFLVGLFASGYVSSQIDGFIIFRFLIAYAIITLSFVLTRNILFPLGLFMMYNIVVLLLTGNTPSLPEFIGYTLLQTFFIALVFTLVNHYDKKPDAKISHLDIISIAIITIVLTAGSVVLAI